MINELPQVCSKWSLSGLLFLCCISNPLWGQSLHLKILDCTSGRRLNNVTISDGLGQNLSEGNTSAGFYHVFVHWWPIFLKCPGYRTRIFYERNEVDSLVCLTSIRNHVPNVVVRGKKGNLSKYLIQLRDKNLRQFVRHDTTIFYRFSYSLQFPEKTWQEQATGYIAYRWQPHKRLPTEAYYLQYHYSCTDTDFWHSYYYRELQTGGVYQLLRYNLMGNDAGYQLWKRLINKENTGLRIPIPQFLLSKKKRRLIKKINRNPRKYHVVQYTPNYRQLSLRIDSDNDQLFEAHFNNGHTSGYVSEKVIFDSLGRLRTVAYFTPEQLPSRYFPLDTATLKTMHRLSKINNDSSYAYSLYRYDVLHHPILLQQAEHLEAFYVADQPYRLSVRIKLVNKEPHKDFRIAAYHWVGGKINGHFVGRTKGRTVLTTIRNLKMKR